MPGTPMLPSSPTSVTAARVLRLVAIWSRTGDPRVTRVSTRSGRRRARTRPKGPPRLSPTTSALRPALSTASSSRSSKDLIAGSMQSMFTRIPERVVTQSPRRSHFAIRVRLGSPARKPGTSSAGRPSPDGGSGQLDGSCVERNSPIRRRASPRFGLPGRVKVTAWAEALTVWALYPVGVPPLRSIDERDREVVAGHHGEDHRVQPVDQASMRAEQPPGVLDAEISLEHRGEQVAHRRHRRDAEAHQQRVETRQPLLVEAREPEAERPADQAAEQPLERLVRRDPGSDPAGPEKAPGCVGGGVAHEGRHQYVDQERSTVGGEVSEQDGVGEAEAHPGDTEHRERDRGRDQLVGAAQGGKPEHHREEGGEDQEDLEGVAEVRRQHHSGDGRVARQHDRVDRAGHPEELPQAEDAEDDHREREDVSADTDDGDGHDHPWDSDHDARGRLGHLRDESLPARALRLHSGGAGLVFLLAEVEQVVRVGQEALLGSPTSSTLLPIPPELERRRIDVLDHPLAPKRRWRSSYSPRQALNASRPKSGQSSSRKTNSEYAHCQSR